jgi:Kef-type K+ transport system membrane component KefB
MPAVTTEVAFLLLIVGLMVVPRVLQRFRIPAPLTSFGLGMAAAAFLGSFSQNETLALLATLGISSLFLFAGLEIDLGDLRRARWPLLGHIGVRAISMTAVAYLAMHFLGFTWQVATLLALVLLTPSTGFILDTLPMLGLQEEERFWVKVKAVGSELFALLVLFIVLQSASLPNLAWSSGALLVVVGLVAAYLTYQLGVYYLVGAFLAGFIARLLRQRMPLLASDENLHAIQMFASFFVPFYFFYKGISVPAGALTLQALGLGAVISLVTLPLRVGVLWLQRRFIAGESAMGSLRVATALMPTLIFTLVLATLLRERYQISDALYGALLFYAGVSTILPSLILARSVDFNLLVGPLPQPGAARGPLRD